MARKPKPKPKRKVVKVKLHPTSVVRVIVPKDHAPLVAFDLAKGIVEIAPVKKEKHWWDTLGDTLFGSED